MLNPTIKPYREDIGPEILMKGSKVVRTRWRVQSVMKRGLILLNLDN